LSDSNPRPGAVGVAAAGLVALAVAMGIGRFAFTPILPMMLHDGVVDLHGASWLASANYLGYLAGALLCTFVPLLWSRRPARPPIDGPKLVRTGLAATAVLTLAMALPVAPAWQVEQPTASEKKSSLPRATWSGASSTSGAGFDISSR